MLRYKAKIEDLEATLAQKGQVGICLLALLQRQAIAPDLPVEPLCTDPSRTRLGSPQWPFSDCVRTFHSVPVPGVLLARAWTQLPQRMRLGTRANAEEEEPCPFSPEWSWPAKAKAYPSSCIRCLYAALTVLHFNVFHPYVSSLCALWPFLPVWSLLSPQKAGPGLFRRKKIGRARDSNEKRVQFSQRLWPQCLGIRSWSGRVSLTSRRQANQPGGENTALAKRFDDTCSFMPPEMLTARYSLSNRIRTG